MDVLEMRSNQSVLGALDLSTRSAYPPRDMRASLACSVLALLTLWVSPVDAQTRRLEIAFTPTARAQVAIWIEGADGTVFETVRLTEAVAYRGIANRPGALQMNSGFRWPYGRREGALPIWAHRRVEVGGHARFPRVVFNGRVSEGNASAAGSAGEPRNTLDNYYCLSFDRDRSGRDALDAVTCASSFYSNKGRYMTAEDERVGYAEPYEMAPGDGMMREMARTSLYPPRRDLEGCASCGDGADVGRFADDARFAMPEIDAVTMASMAGGAPQTVVFDIPDAWPDGDYTVWFEINVEGDYGGAYDDRAYPTPLQPDRRWDYWATNYGYPYRGQPSIVYQVPIRVSPDGGVFESDGPRGYGSVHGEDGEVRPLDGTIVDDPVGAPGSGADRLFLREDGYRLRVSVPSVDVCASADPPPECGTACTPGEVCGDGLLCSADAVCVDRCEIPMQNGGVADLQILEFPERAAAHRWALMEFSAPVFERGVSRYEVRYATTPITDEASFQRALPAVEAQIDTIALVVPPLAAGEHVELEVGGMAPETHYWFAIRAFDECGVPGAIEVFDYVTPEIEFTTVSPCFVATATYESPLEPRVAALRRFRDRYLQTTDLGRTLVETYYAIGPKMAAAVRRDERLRTVSRWALAPAVWFAEVLR
jgi:hypothetical protein